MKQDNAEEQAVLRRVLEGTAHETGKKFLRALVTSLSEALGTSGAWLAEYLPDTRCLRTHAVWMEGEITPDWEMPVDGTPCEAVVTQRELVHYPENLIDLFPQAGGLKKYGAVSYLGVPLFDENDNIFGHLAVIDKRPMDPEPRHLTVFKLFAARAAAELRRIRAEDEARQREQSLGRLFSVAPDGILELDGELRIARLNPAAARFLGAGAEGKRIADVLHPDDDGALRGMIEELGRRGGAERSSWVSGPLRFRKDARDHVEVQATVSRSETDRGPVHTLILRESEERRIRSMSAEAAVLKKELSDAPRSVEIVGESEPMLRALKEANQVAPTEATVLILGETGTGKELFARAVHAGSRRKERALVKVNCAAIPASLMESELFGHEKGAFTGATARREGRFALADKGTLFLDEIGDLPLDLQAKLLRVLQEGEFEPVGSSATRKVDVRVVAATHRDLGAAVKAGTFREDLYYRLNVFPLRLPPLRERSDDTILLAERFCREMAAAHGRPEPALTPDVKNRLRAHGWPGNVRELRNVLERALILGTDGTLDLEGALPGGAESAPPAADPTRVRTARELEDLERRNLLLALEETGGKVWGDKGAAKLLGIHPSTLNSRLKALGLPRPVEK